MDDPSTRCGDPRPQTAGSPGASAAVPWPSQGQGSSAGRPGARTEYSLGRLRGEIADHHHALDWALWKWGHRHGIMTKGELAAALRGISRQERFGLGCMNPFAREVWAEQLWRAVVARGLDRGPMLMPTVLDHRWHFPVGRWDLDLDAIVSQVRAAFAGLDYLLLVEVELHVHLARRFVAPHLHGLLFGGLSQRRHDRVAACFAGGVAGAWPLVVTEAWGLAGACRYPLKPPLTADTYYRSAKGRLFHPFRELSKPEHLFLWRHLHGGFYAKCDGCGGEVRAARPGRPGAAGRPRAACGSRGSAAACR